MKTLLLALGNPILSDDAVGWEVADRLAPLVPPDTEIRKECAATLDLLPRLAGYDRLVVIDAMALADGPVGTVHRLTLDDLASTIRYSSAHDVNFASAFALGRAWGYAIPADVRIYAIEAQELHRFGEGCTPGLAARLDRIAGEIAADLRQ